MTIFKYKAIKKMQPRPGNRFATEFYIQDDEEKARTVEHICDIALSAIAIATRTNRLHELEHPMPGYKRTNGQPNYSQLDILYDMVEQVCKKKHDIPSGMVGRWNRMFDSNPDCQIELVKELPPDPPFNRLFAQK